MDPVTLAGAAAVLLAARYGEGLAEEVARNTWMGLARLTGLVRGKLSRTPDEIAVLERAQQDEAETTDVEVLARVLQQHVEADREFRSRLAALIGAAEEDPAVRPIITRLAAGAEVGKLTIFNGPVHGDVSF